MGGDGLRDHVTKGAITIYLAHAGDSGHDDRDVCNSVGPLCAQHSTQRCGTLFGRGQRGFGCACLRVVPQANPSALCMLHVCQRMPQIQSHLAALTCLAHLLQ